MADFKVTETKLVRDIPGNPQEKGGPAKVLQLTLEGDERQPELFATARTEIPKTVSDDDMEFSDQWNRWQLKKKAAAGGKGGFKRSPAETKSIVRQHSQHMMLLEEANRVAIGQPVFTNDERQQVIDYYEDDVKGKAGTRGLVRFSDVPGNDSDLPWTLDQAEANKRQEREAG